MRVISLLITAAALASCASGPPSAYQQRYAEKESARLEKELAGKVAGKSKSCIYDRNIGGPESYGDDVLLFRVNRNLVYVNKTIGSCPRVGAAGSGLVIQRYSSDLCRGDSARSVDFQTGFFNGACALGDFVPYRRAG